MISLPPEPTKVCQECIKPKPLGEFRKHRDTRDGLYPTCKACERFANAKRESERRPPGSAQQRIPVALPDGTVGYTPAPEDWRVAKATKQGDVRRAVKDLMRADAVCRVLMFAYLTSSVTLPQEALQGDIDWILCNRPKSSCPEIPRSLAKQCADAGVPFFCFDDVGLLPVDGRVYGQVPEILEAVS